MTNNKEIKEDKEFKDKTNNCTQNRADEDAAAAVRLIPNAVKVTRERRHTPACSAVRGNLPKLPKFLKLSIARHHRAADIHAPASQNGDGYLPPGMQGGRRKPPCNKKSVYV